MKTVTEIAQLAHISVRTLHHYDAIGLLKPTEITEAGYRLYDDAALERMNETLSALEVVVPAGEKTSPLAEGISGVTYELEDNPMGISSFEITFNGDGGQVCYHTDRGDKRFPFGLGKYADTVFPETHYSGRRINQPLGKGYRCLNGAVWQAENRLLVRSYVIDDYFGNMAAVFTFEDGKVTLSMTKTAEWFLDEYVGKATGKAK